MTDVEPSPPPPPPADPAPDASPVVGPAPARQGRLAGLVERLGAFDPVIERELRERMRGRPGISLTIYLAIVLLVAWAVHAAAAGSGEDLTGLGRPMFEFVLSAQLVAVLFIVPAAVSGAIAGERERDTLVPLQVTLLRPWRIVVGKVVAGVAFLVLLLVASLPIVMLAYLLGGISFGQILVGTAAVGFLGAVVACVGVAASARARRSQTATVQAYLVVFLMVVGPVMASAAWAIVNGPRNVDGPPPAVLVVPEPFLFVAGVVGGQESAITGGNVGPLTGLAEAVDEVMGARDEWFAAGPGLAGAADGVEEEASARRRYVALSGAFMVALAALSLVVATRAVRTPREVER